ncbi:DUF5343 domain-containing protein [Pseudooceanicola nitratireducens]|jgi:hypothetical protein|uniref:DUF5343 domain-containing protein n=1 Tax=Pseudooceanicola nitratireducens TaxID=517719 RepID=UPI0035124A4F
MASLPYITSAGNIEKALARIKSASVPEKVTQDFVKDTLKIPGGSGDQMTSFLKKIGFADSSGQPTKLYTSYRNPTSSGQAVAEAIRTAYAPLYRRDEAMHEKTDSELTGLVIEETGHAEDSAPVKYTVNCIRALIRHASFEAPEEIDEPSEVSSKVVQTQETPHDRPPQASKSFGLNLGYTININLPATTDQAVFNAIFKSIKQNLLSDDDA